MIENNLENKVKFFAQYWGQQVYKEWKKAELSFVDGNYVGDTDFLQLKPLSAIIDEYCLELYLYIGSGFLKSKLSRIDYVKDILFNGISKEGNLSISNYEYLISFLRSKGYLLPFNGLSCKDMLNRGWAVLEQPKTK